MPALPFRGREHEHSGFLVMMKRTFLPLNVGLIRPIYENAIQTVYTYLQKDIRLVRRFQKPATRYFQFERQLEGWVSRRFSTFNMSF